MKLANTLLLLPATSLAESVNLGLPRVSATDKGGATHTSDDAAAHTSDDAATHPSDDAPLSMRVGVFYGEPSPRKHNRTEAVAKMIAAEAGVEATFFEKPYENYDLASYDAIIVGSPTYNTGAWNYRSTTAWDDWLYEVLPDIDMTDTKVAIFGLGNGFFPKDSQERGYSGYGDMFGDALGEIYDRFSEAGVRVFGATPANNDLENGGLNFTRSKFIRDGMFMGRMFDQYYAPQAALSPGRAKDWVQQLRDEGFFTAEPTHPSDDANTHASDDAAAHTSDDAVTHPSDGAPLSMRVGVFYGEPSPRKHNRTEAVAKMIAAEAGVKATFFEKPYENYNLASYDAVIVGSPTYNTGAWNYRSTTAWDDWLYEVLPDIDMTDTKVAIFGLGNGFFPKDSQERGYSGYGDMFGDALGEIYDRFSEAGVQVFGATPANNDLENGGLNFTRSKFIRDGMFMGRMFDQYYAPQAALSPGRAKDWVQQLRDEGFFNPTK